MVTIWIRPLLGCVAKILKQIMVILNGVNTNPCNASMGEIYDVKEDAISGCSYPSQNKCQACICMMWRFKVQYIVQVHRLCRRIKVSKHWPDIENREVRLRQSSA
mgnify:CR=1 FL=1